jgi:hypothetical protein
MCPCALIVLVENLLLDTTRLCIRHRIASLWRCSCTSYCLQVENGRRDSVDGLRDGLDVHVFVASKIFGQILFPLRLLHTDILSVPSLAECRFRQLLEQENVEA